MGRRNLDKLNAALLEIQKEMVFQDFHTYYEEKEGDPTFPEKIYVSASQQSKKPRGCAYRIFLRGLDAAHDGDSLLHSVTKQGNVDEVDSFLIGGAKIDATNKLGETPLHYAAKYAKPDNLFLLLKKGADPFIQAKNGLTPLEVLFSALYQTPTERSFTCLKHFLHFYPKLRNFITKEGHSLFHLAVKWGCDIDFLKNLQEMLPYHFHKNQHALMELAVNTLFNLNLPGLSLTDYRQRLEVIEYLSKKGVRIPNKIRAVIFTLLDPFHEKPHFRKATDSFLIHALEELATTLVLSAPTSFPFAEQEVLTYLSRLYASERYSSSHRFSFL